MGCTVTRIYTFTCDEAGCGHTHTPATPGLNAALKALRVAGWSAGKHTGVYLCPKHRRTAAQAGRARYSQVRAARVEDYAELRSWGLTRVQAAQRLGVCERTAWRYEAGQRQVAA